MFTLDQIKAAHAKVRSGADFPAYIRDLRELGVLSYTTYVRDGHTDYSGHMGIHLSSSPKYEALTISAEPDPEQFRKQLKAHQQGQTDYPQFCRDCAAAGVEKWEVSIQRMSCTYFDHSGKQVLVEAIPA